MITVKDKQFSLFIDEFKLQERIKELAQEIDKNYKDKNPLFIVILKGAFIFASDFLKDYWGDCEIEFVKLSSYEGMETTGNIKVDFDITDDKIEGRHIVILEDIIDTGATLDFYLDRLKKAKPKSIAVCTLLFKPDKLEKLIQLDYVGFRIKDKFVIGYGLDYDGQARNLNCIYQLDTTIEDVIKNVHEEIIKKSKVPKEYLVKKEEIVLEGKIQEADKINRGRIYKADDWDSSALDGYATISEWEEKKGRGFWGSGGNYHSDKD